jgi:type IV pilus assembly protein PilW
MNWSGLRSRSAHGFSYVELLISLALSAVLLTGIMQLYISTKTTYLRHEQQFNLQRNGWHALQLISDDIRQTGSLAMAVQPELTTLVDGAVAPAANCQRDQSWARMIDQPLLGLDDTREGYETCIGYRHYADSDIVTLRYGRPVNFSTVRQDANRQRLFVAMSTGGTRITNGAGAARINADDIAYFQELVSHSYFVGPATHALDTHQCRTPATSLMSLYRLRLNQRGLPQREELVQGVEQLQVLFGSDTDGDGSVNQYQSADSVTDWQRVTSIRLWILVRSACSRPGHRDIKRYAMGNKIFSPNDGFQRQLFTTTVAIRSRPI